MTELVIFLVAGFFWLAGFCAGLAGRPRPRLGPPKGSYGPRPRLGPPKRSYGPRQPAPGMQRVYYDMPSTIAECGGPCAFGGPELCDCGALWRDVPVRLDEGLVQRGNGHGGPTTPKPPIIPSPQGRTPNPPPSLP